MIDIELIARKTAGLPEVACPEKTKVFPENEGWFGELEGIPFRVFREAASNDPAYGLYISGDRLDRQKVISSFTKALGRPISLGLISLDPPTSHATWPTKDLEKLQPPSRRLAQTTLEE